MFTFTTDLDEDIVGGLGPDEWVLALVPAGVEGADLAHQVGDGGEGAAADRLAVDDAEPDRDQISRSPSSAACNSNPDPVAAHS